MTVQRGVPSAYHPASQAAPPAAPPAPPLAPSVRTERARLARLLLVALVVGVAWACLPFLAGLMGALVLAVTTASLQRRTERRLGARPAAFLITVASALLLAAPLGFLVAAAIHQAPAAFQRVLSSAAFARLSTVRLGPLDVGAQLADVGRSVVSWGSARAVTAAGSVTHSVVNLLLALVGQYYLLLNGPALWRGTRGFVPFSPAGVDRLAGEFTSVTEATLLGVLATALSQGITVGVAFALVSLPNPLFWGAMTGLVSILPILGSSLVWGPGSLVLLLDGRPAAAITLFLIGAVIASNVDNVVRPYVYRRVSGLHPMASLLGAFAGLKLLGVAGLLLGPLALAYCIELFRLYHEEYGDGGPAPGDASGP